jgi:hypothetical protein
MTAADGTQYGPHIIYQWEALVIRARSGATRCQ